MRSKKLYAILGVLLVLSMVLAACPAQTAEPQVVEVEVTRMVEGEVQTVVVTATPEPPMEVSFNAPRPDTYTDITFGDIDTMDPNLAYDTASGGLIMQVMEDPDLLQLQGCDLLRARPGHGSAQCRERRHLCRWYDLHLQHSSGRHLPQWQ